MELKKQQLIQEFINTHKLDNSFKSTALNWFTPVAELLYDHQVRANRPLIIGVNGSQGSGKSTLTAFIKEYLTQLHKLNVAVISLDDFYYSQSIRQELADQVHPLLKTRGVPGTHDTKQLAQVLSSLKKGQSIRLPRFNKATDNPEPFSNWPKADENVDVAILEGWCLGCTAQPKDQLIAPINALEENEDQNGVWRAYANTKLKQDYQPLYELFDFWLMLKAPAFSAVSDWRKQQESKLKASFEPNQDTNGIMTAPEIERFIQHFQRLTELGLRRLPRNMDLTLALDHSRTITAFSGKQSAEFTAIKNKMSSNHD